MMANVAIAALAKNRKHTLISTLRVYSNQNLKMEGGSEQATVQISLNADRSVRNY